ncbi:hypothetical protein E0L93_02205 [Rubrobacter taiwanensis]|jgi:hypothetical protein|uniref:Uncharacterized protein n=1 Tax=Rubrobacter taiwanensis TaxID=185139 RepID=A0A4R1BRH2_9ACTN|nr:hypothetical protein [Rubrobacter taiwanensis]TCJ19795.1 hypothetical protein E0L93_02205 [Rubrobacter taiwanensis]
MVRILERIEGRYEVYRVPHGTVYRWRPGSVVIECDCGERRVFTGSAEPCRCGADYGEVFRELAELSVRGRAVHPPCHEECGRWARAAALREDDYWRELAALDLNGES